MNKEIDTKMVDEKIKIVELQHIKWEYIEQEYVATLIDTDGFEILKGYGLSIIKAINDLHNNLM
ncbi:hypothetical protein [Christiangramia echinicola]|uniref:hypothetical protein n=1 Tax=Christiangramia echinicola TaxID=279359 RepID=UPI000414212E|nr:hypothetical protein [Christiangramia echinicola]